MENRSELEEKETMLEQVAINGNHLIELSDESVTTPEWFDEKNQNEGDESIVHKPLDYSSFGKKEFVNLLKEVASANDFKRAEEIIREVKPLVDSIRNQERAQALARFILEGGTEQDFDYKGDEWDNAFDIYVKSIRENRLRYFREIEEQKNSNLNAKKSVLEKLRELADGEDTEHSLRNFKELQKEWKAIGQVPQNEVKTLWANYHALVDRYYDQRSIYFELKELDRKKNLELKKELIARAEHLLSIENIGQATKELNDLHDDFRHIGPVPLEDKEAIWQKFKAASDAVYAKRDVKVAELLKELQHNLAEKEKINAEIVVFAEFNTDRIKDWNQKTKEIQELQKKWESIGGVPRANTRDVNRKFWNSLKAFFHNKNVFFKKLDAERNANLQLKTELLNKAIALKESNDWHKASAELKSLQQQWKEIGPVPEKQREKIFQQFKEACDYFFNQLRSQMTQAEKEQHDVLSQKEIIIKDLQKMAENGNGTIEQVKEMQARFMGLGMVPKQAIHSVNQRFSESLSKAIASLPLSKNEKDNAELGMQIAALKQSHQGDKKIHHKEFHLRKQIAKAENDIATLRNNLEFFGRSKNAEKMKEEFSLKIKEADEALLHLKKQLQMVQAS
ncbi:MAG: hypothetical protein OJF59_002743 [Cytophagales bacterium]|jgi:hypothetical protein|nr:DUF349 domain-containing protein [Bacteroidota bacterium]MBS1981679.1 DUF349 domain-containing protein [Bacteroidota bacterium]WHZ08989.1 MAG: hypothetical protein OJF59_002743 [Cytophagales bacterium]